VPVFAGGDGSAGGVGDLFSDVVVGGAAVEFEAVSVFENEPATASATRNAATSASGTT
jgi:hypothetical protein